ncbi:MAG: hypothetical protein LIO98_01040 [Cloacibacillus sp.]|nr:hypothetical protein [Cloacibacillus sp.]
MGVTFTPIVRQGSNYYQGDSVLPLEDIATGKVLLEFSSGDMPNVNMEMASYVGLHIDNGDTMIGRNEIYIKSITLDFN